MKKKKVTLAILLACSMMAGLVGCGGSDTAETPADASEDASTSEAASTSEDAAAEETTGTSGEDLKVMIETPVESIDPQIGQDGTSFEVIADFTDGLMQMDADGQAVPAIAESYEVSDDGLTYTFHLREDAKWSNGTPVTAADFVFGWQRAVDPNNASEYSYMLSDIGQIKNAAEIIAGEKDKSELGVTEITLDMVLDADDAPQKVAQVIKEQWETTLPGLTLNLVVEPKKQRLQDMQEGNFQIGLTRWGPDYADPMTYLGMWVTDNSNNYGFWSNADYDAIIAECTTGDLCTDPEGRWAKLYEAEQIVMDEAVIFPLYTQCNAEMLSSKVTGVEYHPVALNRVYKNAVKAE